MIFLRILPHLLPNARAWRLTADKKLRQLFDGLSGTGSDARTFFDDAWSDVFPATTRELGKWEQQFGLGDAGLTEQSRRGRLDATWKALGGQDPDYIQNTLRATGFDVYVHEWWEPGTEPAAGNRQCATPRNPFSVLSNDNIVSGLTVTCGNPAATCGNPAATAGAFEVLHDVERRYFIPIDSSKWPYFLYIGGENFPDLAAVETSRKDEFEALCLKICPTQQWLGILVEYS